MPKRGQRPVLVEIVQVPMCSRFRRLTCVSVRLLLRSQLCRPAELPAPQPPVHTLALGSVRGRYSNIHTPAPTQAKKVWHHHRTVLSPPRRSMPVFSCTTQLQIEEPHPTVTATAYLLGAQLPDFQGYRSSSKVTSQSIFFSPETFLRR